MWHSLLFTSFTRILNRIKIWIIFYHSSVCVCFFKLLIFCCCCFIYRNVIGRCSSHAERFSILLSIISLKSNHMNNNISSFSSFKCGAEYALCFVMYGRCFFSLLFFLFFIKYRLTQRYWIYRSWIKRNQSESKIKQKQRREKKIESIGWSVVLWLFVLIKNARCTLATLKFDPVDLRACVCFPLSPSFSLTLFHFVCVYGFFILSFSNKDGNFEWIFWDRLESVLVLFLLLLLHALLFFILFFWYFVWMVSWHICVVCVCVFPPFPEYFWGEWRELLFVCMSYIHEIFKSNRSTNEFSSIFIKIARRTYVNERTVAK